MSGFVNCELSSKGIRGYSSWRGRGIEDGHTNSGADITSTEGLDGQIRVDLANDLCGVSMRKMSFLE